MPDRCELSDLPVDMCSHCRGMDGPGPRPQLIVMREITARYNGRCEVCGEWTIREGDPLYLVDEITGDREDLWAGTCCVGDRR